MKPSADKANIGSSKYHIGKKITPEHTDNAPRSTYCDVTMEDLRRSVTMKSTLLFRLPP